MECLKDATNERGLGLTHKHYTKLEKLTWDKHASLFETFVNYGSSITLAVGQK